MNKLLNLIFFSICIPMWKLSFSVFIDVAVMPWPSLQLNWLVKC